MQPVKSWSPSMRRVRCAQAILHIEEELPIY